MTTNYTLLQVNPIQLYWIRLDGFDSIGASGCPAVRYSVCTVHHIKWNTTCRTWRQEKKSIRASDFMIRIDSIPWIYTYWINLHAAMAPIRKLNQPNQCTTEHFNQSTMKNIHNIIKKYFFGSYDRYLQLLSFWLFFVIPIRQKHFLFISWIFQFN